jgi:hypothetical protein
MNALVVPEPDGLRGRILLSRAEADSTVLTEQRTVPVAAREGAAVSAPLQVGGDAFLSGIDAVVGDGGGWEVRWGREILWLGGFESEGADLWDVNSVDEWLDDEVALAGARSLAVRRHASDGDQTGTDLEKHLPCDPTKEHTAVSWLRAEQAAGARTMVRFYNNRYTETPLVSEDVAEWFTGDTDWRRQWRDLDTPEEATYFELRCGLEPPESGTGRVWFDELAMIEWEPWQPADAALDVPAPNNHRFVQVRRLGGTAGEVTVAWRETAYGDVTTQAPETVPAAGRSRLVCYPNPCNPRTTVQLDLPLGGAGRCELALYDLRGRRVATLHRGPLAGAGPHAFSWDGTDDGGRALASGVYLARAVADGRLVQGKVVLVR